MLKTTIEYRPLAGPMTLSSPLALPHHHHLHHVPAFILKPRSREIIPVVKGVETHGCHLE